MRHTLRVQIVADRHRVRSVGNVGRREGSLQLRLRPEVCHALLRVLVLQASELGLNVGMFLAIIRLKCQRM